MTQRKAIVPYTTDPDEPSNMLDMYHVWVTRDGVALIHGCCGKLAKADVEKALEAATRAEYGYDVVPGPTRRKFLLDALDHLGISVEE